MAMRIQFERTGGFAGMRTVASMDSDSLSPEQAQELQALVDAADFFNLPSRIEDSGEGADQFQYTIAIESEGRAHTVECGEGSAPDSLRALLRRLTVMARSR